MSHFARWNGKKTVQIAHCAVALGRDELAPLFALHTMPTHHHRPIVLGPNAMLDTRTRPPINTCISLPQNEASYLSWQSKIHPQWTTSLGRDDSTLLFALHTMPTHHHHMVYVKQWFALHTMPTHHHHRPMPCHVDRFCSMPPIKMHLNSSKLGTLSCLIIKCLNSKPTSDSSLYLSEGRAKKDDIVREAIVKKIPFFL